MKKFCVAFVKIAIICAGAYALGLLADAFFSEVKSELAAERAHERALQKERLEHDWIIFTNDARFKLRVLELQHAHEENLAQPPGERLKKLQRLPR